MVKKQLIKITALFFLLIVLSFSQQKNNAADLPVYKKNPNYESFMKLFETYKLKQADIVFLGNSITQGGNWTELLGRKNIANRGIPGDVLEGFLARINDVIKLRPEICIIMGGINDVYAWIPVETIYKNYIKLLRRLKRKSVKPILISTLYAAKEYPNSETRNKEISKLNKKVKKYANQYNIEYLDLNKFLSQNEYLKQDVTFDGIHLNWLGYKIWTEQLDKILQKAGY
ncbi:MAG: D-alanyl-lipoteichoic acid biosynthesis protein DltD [Rhodothermaceae bacterium]